MNNTGGGGKSISMNEVNNRRTQGPMPTAKQNNHTEDRLLGYIVERLKVEVANRARHCKAPVDAVVLHKEPADRLDPSPLLKPGRRFVSQPANGHACNENSK